MGSTRELGGRIELVSMDPHCFNITIGLYEQSPNGTPQYLVHSYSNLPAARARLQAVAQAMQVLGGLEQQQGCWTFRAMPSIN